jgi:hypothetical protein
MCGIVRGFESSNAVLMRRFVVALYTFTIILMGQRIEGKEKSFYRTPGCLMELTKRFNRPETQRICVRIP